MSTIWYSDAAAQKVHALWQRELERIIAHMCPSYELSHIGINRNQHTEEITMVLHLNQIGRVRVVPDAPADESWQALRIK